MVDQTNVELVFDAKALCGEGPLWDETSGRLYWVDIESHRLHLHTPGGADESFEIKPYVSSIVPRQSGGFVLTLQDGFYAFDPATGAVEPIAKATDFQADNRFNDGKCDPAGRFWAGTTSLSGEPSVSALYRMDPDRSIENVLTGVSISNGLAWSADGKTMYYIDSLTLQVVAFDYDLAAGTLSNRRVVVEIPKEQGLPDGMTIDAEGMIWVAVWGGWGVSRWNPATGELLRTIRVPASQVTSCAFGGPNLDELYITTARTGLTDEELEQQPHAGGLFRVKPGVRGTPTDAYRG